MNPPDDIEILLVEDNPRDAELTLRALHRRNLANSVFHVLDGAAPLDFIFANGIYTYRSIHRPPKIVLLDLKLRKVDGLEVLRSDQGRF
jgi:two-component system response regulator